MAYIRERTAANGKKRYLVQIRKKGAKPINRTFHTKTEAQAYIQDKESDIRNGRHFPAQEAERRTLGELIDKYVETVLPEKSESTRYGQSIQLAHWRRVLGYKTLSALTTPTIADERDKLLQGTTARKAQGKLDIKTRSKGKIENSEIECKRRSPATVVRYLAVLSHCLSYAQKELGWITDNPCRNIRKPVEPRGRVRILDEDEKARLLAACKGSRNKHLHDVVILLLSTGARKNEILHLRWQHVDLEQRVIVLDKTKNGDRRKLPIRGEAERILKERSKLRRIDTPLIFPAPMRHGKEAKPLNIQSAWDTALERAKIEDFRIHDLRHCAASAMAMNGASLPELAALLGHRQLSMVQRYAHFCEGHGGDLIERMNAAMFDTKGADDEKQTN